MSYKVNPFFLISIFSFAFVMSCKKDNHTENDLRDRSTRSELTYDSIYLYAKAIWFWNDSLPTDDSFNPRKYEKMGEPPATYRLELKDMVKYSQNPQTNRPYELPNLYSDPKYSFFEGPKQLTSGNLALSKNASGTGLGFEIGQWGSEMYITYVYPGSPADAASLRRGYRILNVNFSDDNSYADIIYTGSDSIVKKLHLQKKDFRSNTVFMFQVFRLKKGSVGYLALGQFVPLDFLQPELDSIFRYFSIQKVSYLVIDLRYNSGGYLSTAEYLANLIAPSSLNGKVMFSEHFNTFLQRGQAKILNQQPYFDSDGKRPFVNGHRATYLDIDFTVNANTYIFKKAGQLNNIKALCFITGGQTASASEMLINCFKPYIPVMLIGSQTYGKPVGFFPIRIDQYDLYLASFKIVNANGTGDYFSGIKEDLPSVDDIRFDFGDSREACLKNALDAISNNLAVDEVDKMKSGGRKAILQLREHRNIQNMFEDRVRFRNIKRL